MASPTPKRLQVFVSSTYDDLKPERQAAVAAILQAGHIPAGMELFAAGDQSQMEVIRRWIDDSDVFLLILGGRYGSIEPESGKSYTHLEFEHAVAKGKPRFACVIREAAATKRGEQDGGSKLIELENPAKLKEFRAEVGKRMVEPWEDAKDIMLGIHKALAEIERREDLVGFVRADASFNAAEMANELARLSRENAELREKGAAEKYCGLPLDSLTDELEHEGLDSLLFELREETSIGGDFDSSIVVQRIATEFATDKTRVAEGIRRLENIGLVSIERTQRGNFLSLTPDCKRYLNRMYHKLGEEKEDVLA